MSKAKEASMGCRDRSAIIAFSPMRMAATKEGVDFGTLRVGRLQPPPSTAYSSSRRHPIIVVFVDAGRTSSRSSSSKAASLRASRSARSVRQACEQRFRQTDFALEDFRSAWLNTANLSAYVHCLYQLRTRLRPLEKRIFAAGIHYPTLLVANHQSPPVSTSGSQWCWLDEKGTGSNGLSPRFCCDPRKGPQGDLSCWDDYFNFELCCQGDVQRGELPHYFVAPAFDINVGNMVRQMGTFDLGQSYALQSLCQLGDTVIDVGANVGGFTVPLAERVGKKGKVYAFEPFRKIYQHLNANVALNGLTNVYAFNNALGTEVKELDIHAPDLTYWNFPSAIRVDEQYNRDDALKEANLRYEDELERIYIRPLDSFRIEGKVSLIKIDVEFMELQVVLGARELIRKHQPVMWVENEPFFDDPPDRTFVETMQKEFDYACKSMARLELLCTPSNRKSLPNGFHRVLQHLSGAASEAKLWTALADDYGFEA
eukprot:CAMPEP_0206427050 /NCGR_PEP_ID=MMETSP0324_2-20121206/4782_1 /ASSEMBLY_ACC=CAM_ASM_000836 /TAXON_ID=2866 /ORGANISM="Crypthecodinium cohnii, Strain Seligo" /LENGTH=483 /DNA_ID=CAMNT_0053892201 /DNA_START=92 /DNA_END=1544 /DNA_ORIENTATION=+